MCWWVPVVLKECGVFIFRVKQPKNKTYPGMYCCIIQVLVMGITSFRGSWQSEMVLAMMWVQLS